MNKKKKIISPSGEGTRKALTTWFPATLACETFSITFSIHLPPTPSPTFLPYISISRKRNAENLHILRRLERYLIINTTTNVYDKYIYTYYIKKIIFN